MEDMNTNEVTKGSRVTTTKADGTTWKGNAIVVRHDGTALVQWVSPMKAKSIDFPVADLTVLTVTAKVDRVEDGFARVLNADTGQVIGYVSRHKHGSGRTEVRWTATRTNSARPMVLGHGATRAEAVAVVAKNAARFL